MKKTTLSLLFAVIFSLVGFAQGHETFENLETTGNSYQDGSFLGQDGSTWEYIQARGDAEADVNDGDQAIMLGRNRTPDAYVQSGTIANGIGTLKFSYKQAFGTDVNLEVYVNDDLVYTATTDSQVGEAITTDLIDVNIEGDVVIKFYNPSGAGQVNIDDVIWTAMGNDPTLSITSPASGAELSPLETPSITFNVTNFDISTSATANDGDGYVQYKVNDESFENYFTTDPIVLENLEGGEQEVTLQLVDNNGDVLDPEISKTVSFTVNEIIETSSIGSLRESDLEAYYTLTSEVILTYQQDFRSQKYIQDATGAILIDDNDGVLTTEYNQYDGITGITGKLQEHNGLLQFVPITDAGEITSTDNSIEVVVLTISDFMADPVAYESQVIAFENVHFEIADGTEVFATGQNYDITDGVDETIMRTNFFDADYIGDIIPEGTQSAIAGIASHFNGSGQIFSRDQNDLNGTVLSVEDFQKTDINLYPNPATDKFFVNVDNNAQVEVYSILGQKVISTQVANGNTPIAINNLKAGVYMVKISHNGNIVTKKLVIK